MYAFVNERKGGLGMKVSIELSPEYRIPYAVIYADKITDEIQKIMESFSRQETPITALQNEENLVVLQPEENLYGACGGRGYDSFGKCSKYRSRKRLYELEKQLGKQFMQISKSTLVNLSYLESIEAGFNGTLLLKLKNGCKDYVSRKYLPEFKKYLGL